MDSLIKEFSARFSQFKELSETFKFIMYPDVISFDKLNLSQFDWLEIEELEMQLIDFQSSSIWIQKFIETRKKLELIEAERLTSNISKNTSNEILETWNSIPDSFKEVGEKEYNINSKYAKLDNFLISASSSSCVSACSSNVRELDEQILEVKINPQEKNTVSDTSTNKNTLSKEKESENENEETKLIRNDFAHYVGTPTDADLKEKIFKLGPYQPEGNFQKDAKERSFSSSYNFISTAGQKIEKEWLCYSTRLHVAYCQVCWLFADRTNMYFKEALCKDAGITPGKCIEVNLSGEGLMLGLPHVAENSSR
ncbi:dimer_Tnp_hAT domain-containing protein [Trichonephila clavipes]|nr:dimer_Tnp_hAT domain-containing protein [Trichonephila clavipes]